MTTAAREIGRRTFTAQDQQLFARLSRDTNPMHMDPVVARRLITGRQVVHGVHVAMTALEHWGGAAAVAPLRALSCSFNNPVSVGEEVVFNCTVATSGVQVLEGTVDGLVCARLELVTGQAAQVSPSPTAVTAATDSARPPLPLDVLAEPLDLPPEDHLGKRYAFTLETADWEGLFPQCHAVLGGQGCAALGALSRIVGMVCPGLHSVFSSLAFALRPQAAQDSVLYFSADKYDRRIRMYEIGFDGCLRGTIRAFRRPSPQPQASMEALAAQVRAHEFAGTRSLVIGGSRGLGEGTAKILAAGGGDVLITYASGAEDACAICDEINRAALGPCATCALDLLLADFEALGIDWKRLDAIYFFATPRIYRKKADLFSAALFREFCDFYVGRFHALCAFLEAVRDDGTVVKVYLPSTVFIEQRPKGMAEYAMAKAAVEVLAQEINRGFKKVRVHCTRLPRLSTDQTSSVFTGSAGSNVATLLATVRAMHQSIL